MTIIDELKKSGLQYKKFSLIDNPFKIDPLFRDFRDKELCEKQESLFVLPSSCHRHIKSISHLKDRRCLIYGGYGVGKTSLIDLVLYLNYNFHKRFCLRVIITEDNVERAINEMLLSLCMEIIDHLSSRSVSKPIQSIQKWLIEKKFGDSLLTSMAQLIGRYSQEQVNISKKKKNHQLVEHLLVLE